MSRLLTSAQYEALVRARSGRVLAPKYMSAGTIARYRRLETKGFCTISEDDIAHTTDKGHEAIAAFEKFHDGTEGQDRKSYTDTQDRKSYA